MKVDLKNAAATIAIAALWSLNGCGGGSDEAAPSTETPVETEMVTTGEPPTGTETSEATAPNSSTVAEGPTEESVTPNTLDLVIESQTVIYLPDQAGGNFYEVLVVVHNPSEQVALDVSGQVSLVDEQGDLIESVNPTPINILAGGRGLILETFDLTEVADNVAVESILEAEQFRDGPTESESPVVFTNVNLVPDEFSGCSIKGTVANRFSEAKENLQLRVVGYRAESVVTGGFTYVYTVFPGVDATFEVNLVSPALCPDDVDAVFVMPNLGDDKIFNP